MDLFSFQGVAISIGFQIVSKDKLIIHFRTIFLADSYDLSCFQSCFCVVPKIVAISQKELLRGFLILINLPIHSNSITMLSRFAVAARNGVTAVKYPFFER